MAELLALFGDRFGRVVLWAAILIAPVVSFLLVGRIWPDFNIFQMAAAAFFLCVILDGLALVLFIILINFFSRLSVWLCW